LQLHINLQCECRLREAGAAEGGAITLPREMITHMCYICICLVIPGLSAGPAEAGAAEGKVIMLPPARISPRLTFGCPLEALLELTPPGGSRQEAEGGPSGNGSGSDLSSGLGSGSDGSRHGSSGVNGAADKIDSPLAGLLPGGGVDGGDAASLVDVYRDDDYVLTWRGGAGRAMLREGAPKTTPLQVRDNSNTFRGESPNPSIRLLPPLDAAFGFRFRV